MGLWNLLTKDISFGRSNLKWGEPPIYRLRLKRDLPWRVLLVAACWLAATGIMLIIFSQNQNEESSGLAWGLGFVFGFLPSTIFFFLRKDDVGGQVQIRNGKVEVSRTYVGLTAQWKQTKIWDLHAPDRYHICPAEKLGHNFHAVFCKIGSQWELLGVPQKIDLKQLSAELAAGGSEIKIASKIPEKFQKGYSPALAGGLGVVGAVLFVVGFLLFEPEEGPQRPVEMADLPNPGFPNAQPPGLNPGGNPLRGNPAPAQNVPPENTSAPETPGNNSFPIPNSSPSFKPQAPTGFPGSPPSSIPNLNPPGSNPFGPSTIPRPNSSDPPPDLKTTDSADVGNRSELVGGDGGFPFTQVAPQQDPVVGVRVRMGSWAGKEHLSKVEPLYQKPRPIPNTTVVVAKPGYVLGAIEINAPEFVDGIRLVFMKQTEMGVDPTDHVESQWIGNSTPKPERLENEGKPIIGFHGKGGAVMDALGVIFAD
ncbi:MAG: hypothetical protein HUJ26_11900 [Planctomycetaceae bacterium]|nr:hypothetical protein [Planctomycetaceae bacterium]